MQGIKNIFNKIKNVITKQSEAQKEEKEQKKKYKNTRPKGFLARRIGLIVSWAVIGLFIISTLSNILFSGSGSEEEGNTLQDVNFLYADGGNEFAKDFLYEFYNWDHSVPNGEDGQTLNLSKYVVNGIESRIPELAFNEEWESSINKNDISLKNIDKVSSNKALLTYKVDYELTRNTDKKDSKIDTKEMSPQEYKNRMKQPIFKDGKEIVNSSKYIEVPVYYDDNTEEFVVYDVPSYTSFPEGNIADVPKFDIENLTQVTDSDVTDNINAFLDTFFESYAEDTPDKLSYLIDEDNIQEGLNGAMTFNQANETKIYSLDRDKYDRLFVNTEVTFNDPQADGVTYNTDYLLVIKKEEGRYIVESLNDESYAKGIIAEYRNTLDKENEDNEYDDKIDRLNELNDREKIKYKKQTDNDDSNDSSDNNNEENSNNNDEKDNDKNE